MKWPVELANRFKEAALDARIRDLVAADPEKNLAECHRLASHLVSIQTYYELVELLGVATPIGNEEALLRTIGILRAMCGLAPVVNEARSSQKYLAAYLGFLELIVARANAGLIASAAREVIAAATAAGFAASVVERLRSTCEMAVRGFGLREHADEIEAEHNSIDQERRRHDEMSASEKRALQLRIHDVTARVRTEVREVRRFVRNASVLRSSYRGCLHPRARRARRAPRRTVARRVQADSGGASDDSSDGPGEPPRRRRRSRFAACGLAPVRPGRPRDQLSTARYDARAPWVCRSDWHAGEGHIPRPPGLCRVRAARLPRPPSGGPVRLAHGGGHRG